MNFWSHDFCSNIYASKCSYFNGDQKYQWILVHKCAVWTVQGIKVWIFHLILTFWPAFIWRVFFRQMKEGENVKIKWKFQNLTPSTDWNTHLCTKTHWYFWSPMKNEHFDVCMHEQKSWDQKLRFTSKLACYQWGKIQ